MSSGEAIVYGITAIIFLFAFLVSLFVGVLDRAFSKYVASVTVALAFFLALFAYVTFYTEGSLYSRSDGNSVHAIRFAFEAAAAALLMVGLVSCAKYACYEIVFIGLTTLFWGVFLLLGSNSETQGAVIAALIFAAVIAIYSFYLLYTGRFIKDGYISLMSLCFVGFVLLLHLGYILCQPGLGIIGPLGTAFWFAGNDFLLYVVVGALVLMCPDSCNVPADLNACCRKCYRVHAPNISCHTAVSQPMPATPTQIPVAVAASQNFCSPPAAYSAAVSSAHQRSTGYIDLSNWSA